MLKPRSARCNGLGWGLGFLPSTNVRTQHPVFTLALVLSQLLGLEPLGRFRLPDGNGPHRRSLRST